MNLQDSINKSLALSETMQKNMLEMYKMGMGTLSWSQQQYDNTVQKQFARQQQLREEAAQLVESSLQQAEKGQQHWNKMMQEYTDLAFEKTDYPGFNYFTDMNNKLQKLYEKVFGQEA